MRKISSALIFLLSCLILTFSCNNQDTKNHLRQKDSSNFVIDSNTNQQLVLNIDSLSKIHNYSNWTQFWDTFKIAAANMDTSKIVGLTNFPFLQNGGLTSKNEFIQIWISQIYGIEKDSSSPINTEGLNLHIHQQFDTNIYKIDSIRYTNCNQKDFYFAKVNGYYKLIEIITPGWPKRFIKTAGNISFMQAGRQNISWAFVILTQLQ